MVKTLYDIVWLFFDKIKYVAQEIGIKVKIDGCQVLLLKKKKQIIIVIKQILSSFKIINFCSLSLFKKASIPKAKHQPLVIGE